MMAGVKFQNVPYRGSAPALQDLVAGSVDVISKADFGKIVLAEAGLRCPIELTSLKSLKSEVRRSFNMSLNSMRLYRDLGVAGFKVRDSIIGVLAKSRGAGN